MTNNNENLGLKIAAAQSILNLYNLYGIFLTWNLNKKSR